MAARGIHDVDLAVADLDASLAFYVDLLAPLGLAEEVRYPTYRGTEEVVYLVGAHDRRGIGLRPANGGPIATAMSVSSTSLFEVGSRDDVDAAHERCVARGARVHFPPQEDRDEAGYYAFFVFDPNGMRIEGFCWSRADRWAVHGRPRPVPREHCYGAGRGVSLSAWMRSSPPRHFAHPKGRATEAPLGRIRCIRCLRHDLYACELLIGGQLEHRRCRMRQEEHPAVSQPECSMSREATLARRRAGVSLTGENDSASRR